MSFWFLISVIKSIIGFSCPMLLHDEMQATLYRRHKASYSDSLSPRASYCLVRVLVIVSTRATLCDAYTQKGSKPGISLCKCIRQPSVFDENDRATYERRKNSLEQIGKPTNLMSFLTTVPTFTPKLACMIDMSDISNKRYITIRNYLAYSCQLL